MVDDDNETIDDVLDRLPPSLRYKVMKEAWGDQEPETPLPPLPKGKFAAELVLSYVVGIPLALIGLILCMTIVLAPLGIACIIASGALLSRTIKRRVQEHAQRENPDDVVEKGHQGDVK